MWKRVQELLENVDRGAWKRLLTAVLGLPLALISALLSTLAAEQGQIWLAVFLAAAALVLAAVVGTITIPYLAGRVAARRVRDALNYDVTREGAIYLVLTIIIGIAALNTGNNLLFIIVSAMLAAVVVSGIASAVVILGLDLDVAVPEHVFAESTATGRLTLRNRNRLIPAFSVSVVPPRQKRGLKRLRLQRSSFRFPPKADSGKEWVRWPDLAVHWSTEPPLMADVFSGSVYFPFIPARRAAIAELQMNFLRRGCYVQDAFALSTKFPFSFLTKTRTINSRREVIVYPSVQPTDEFFEMLPLITGEFESYVRGRGFDLYRIRDYSPEDSARYVDWKASARTGDLKVREFTREDERKLRLVFDNPARNAVPEAAYEHGVALAASLAWHFAGEGTELSFAAPGYDGGQDVYDFLRYLALVGPAEEGESILDRLQFTDDYNIVVTARRRGYIPTPLWNSAYFVFVG